MRSRKFDMGTPLFLREGRGIVLSEAGLVFPRLAREVLARVAEARRPALRASQGQIGALTLSFTESASFNALVASIISRS